MAESRWGLGQTEFADANGCVERFIRTLKEKWLWVRTFRNIEELRQAVAEFRERYQRWIVQRLGYRPPRPGTIFLHSERRHEYTQFSGQPIQCGSDEGDGSPQVVHKISRESSP